MLCSLIGVLVVHKVVLFGDLISKFVLVVLTLCMYSTSPNFACIVRFFQGLKTPGIFIYIAEMIITNWKMVKNQIQWKLP